jgi:murein DD-endopeptidase MepM/ murein hydrolase activator NlpD
MAVLGWLGPTATAPQAPAPEVAAAGVPAPQFEPAVRISAPVLKKETLGIRKRDTVVAALIRHKVASRTAHEIAGALKAAGANLRQVRPGDELELSRDSQGRVAALAYAPSAWLRFEATDTRSGWQATVTEIEPEVRIEVRQGEIGQSLWEAVDAGAMAPSVLLDLVQIFESEIDFTVDVRPGDRFRLLVETRYAAEKLVDHGRILVAQYVGNGQMMTGVGFQGAERFSYYDLDGHSLKRAFLRSPLQFTRISSGFTYRRPHPILGGVRPHLAIDYAAPRGTPVWAVADGVVQFAGRNRGNGIQVLLRHRSGYKTYYNHLSRIARGVHRGARISQKQVIGYVGSTGLSTGPHLDYRVSHNGRFVNPLNEKFVPGKSVDKARREQFLEHARALLERLEKDAPFSVDRT